MVQLMLSSNSVQAFAKLRSRPSRQPLNCPTLFDPLLLGREAGPLFVRIRKGDCVTEDRLSDRHVARPHFVGQAERVNGTIKVDIYQTGVCHI